MADINHIISLGIGSPAAIKEFLTVGLQIGAPPAYTTADAWRTFTVPAQTRTHTPPAVSRTYTPPAVSRTYVVPAEDDGQ